MIEVRSVLVRPQNLYLLESIHVDDDAAELHSYLKSSHGNNADPHLCAPEFSVANLLNPKDQYSRTQGQDADG